MDNQIYYDLLKVFPKERIFINEPMSKHTSFRIGGNADYFIKANSIEEIQATLEISKTSNTPLTIIGNGSNLLVRDKGIRGIVLKIDLQKYEINKKQDKTIISVEAGMPLAKLSKIAEQNSLTGLEFGCGIPGTIGGAIRMNAGAYGGEIKDVVLETTYLTRDAKLKTITKQEHEFSYRNSIFSTLDVIIIKTEIELRSGNLAEIQEKMQNNLKSRKEKQPLNYPNAGSTFKRGSDFITAQLIDQCGLKGYKIGDAMVSTLHAGFLVNIGNATCDDMLKLISHVRKQVKQKFDKEIVLEVLILGEE